MPPVTLPKPKTYEDGIAEGLERAARYFESLQDYTGRPKYGWAAAAIRELKEK